MKEILYKDEHASCIYFDRSDKPSIEIKQIKGNDGWQVIPQIHKIVIILKGSFHFISGKNDTGEVLQTGHMLFLASGISASFQGNSFESEILVIRIINKTHFCETYRLEHLWQQINKQDSQTEILRQDSFHLLDVNVEMGNYLFSLVGLIRSGFRCQNYLSIKIKEFFYILRCYYTKEDLFHFFRSLLSSDMIFSQQVMEHYAKCHSAKELAKVLNYSVSGFEKRFKKVFNDTPYHWMMTQRAYDIHTDIIAGEMNFKQISDKYGFSSPSVMNDFIKQMFDMTPGQIRKGIKK